MILYYTLPVVADTFIYFYSLEDTNYFCYSLNLFINSNPADIYNFVFKNKSWPFFRRFKKHACLSGPPTLAAADGSRRRKGGKGGGTGAGERWRRSRPSAACAGLAGWKKRIFLSLGRNGRVNQVYVN